MSRLFPSTEELEKMSRIIKILEGMTIRDAIEMLANCEKVIESEAHLASVRPLDYSSKGSLWSNWRKL